MGVKWNDAKEMGSKDFRIWGAFPLGLVELLGTLCEPGVSLLLFAGSWQQDTLKVQLCFGHHGSILCNSQSFSFGCMNLLYCLQDAEAVCGHKGATLFWNLCSESDLGWGQRQECTLEQSGTKQSWLGTACPSVINYWSFNMTQN